MMRRRLFDLLFKNFWLKILALVIAVAMWFGIARDPEVETMVNAPIEFHHVPENLEINTENLPHAQIRVRGPARIVRDLAQAEVHPVIDLQGAGTGERTYDIRPAQIQLPHEVTVAQIVPAQIRVSFDRRATKQVEVRPRVLGTFAAGYRIADAHPEPRTVTITGPERRVQSIESVLTDPVDASGVIGRGTFTTHAYLPDPLVRFVNPEPIQIVVTTEKVSSRANP